MSGPSTTPPCQLWLGVSERGGVCPAASAVPAGSSCCDHRVAGCPLAPCDFQVR